MVGVAISVQVRQVDALDLRGAGDHRRAVAVVDGVAPSSRTVVFPVAEAHGARERCAFVERAVATGVQTERGRGCVDLHCDAGGVGEGAVLVKQRHRDGACTRAGVRVVHVARRIHALHRRAVAPVDEVLRDAVGARVGDRTQVQRVALPRGGRGRAAQGNRRRHVVDGDDLVGRGGRPTFAVAHADVDRARCGIDRTVLVVGEDVGDVAAERCQLRGREHLRGRAVAPVDAVGQRIVGAGRIAGRGNAQRVGGSFVGAGRAAQCADARRHVVDGDGLAAQCEGAVLIGGLHDDGGRRAALRPVGVGVGEAARCAAPLRCREVAGAAVSPVDAVAGARVRRSRRIHHRPHAQRVHAAFVAAVGTSHRRRRGHVAHRHGGGASVGKCAVLVRHADADVALRVVVQSVVVVLIGVLDLPAGCGECSCGDSLHGRTITPVDCVLGRGVGTRFDLRQRQRVGAALVDRANTPKRHRWCDVVHRHRKGIGALLRARVIDGHRRVVRRRTVRVGMGDIKASDPGPDVAAAGLPIAPDHAEGAARRALVGRVGQGDRLAELRAFVDGDVLPCVDGQDLGRLAHREALAAGVGEGAVLVDQRDIDGLRPGRAEGVWYLPIGRQGSSRYHLDRCPVTPVDAVLRDGVVAGIARCAERQGVALTLFDVAAA